MVFGGLPAPEALKVILYCVYSCMIVCYLDHLAAFSAYSSEPPQKLQDQSGTLSNAGKVMKVVYVAAWAREGVRNFEPLTAASSAHMRSACNELYRLGEYVTAYGAL